MCAGVASPVATALVRVATLVIAVLMASVTFASSSERMMDFDMPMQPLDKALQQFDAKTGLSVFFPSGLTKGRVASAVFGRYRPADALRGLLDGSGLESRPVAEGAYVLEPVFSASASRPMSLVAQTAHEELRRAMQVGIWQALCASNDTYLGTYRLAFAVRVNGGGEVEDVSLLDTTGDAAVDTAVVSALRGLALGVAPEDQEKPVVIVLHPREADSGPSCPPDAELHKDE